LVTAKELNTFSAYRDTLELPISFGNYLVKQTQKHHGLSKILKLLSSHLKNAHDSFSVWRIDGL